MKEEKLIKAALELNQKKGLNIIINNTSTDKLKLSIKRQTLLISLDDLSEETQEVIRAIKYPKNYIIKHLGEDIPKIIPNLGFEFIEIQSKKKDYIDFKITFYRDLTERELKSVDDLAKELGVEVEHISACEVIFSTHNSN